MTGATGATGENGMDGVTGVKGKPGDTGIYCTNILHRIYTRAFGHPI